MELTKEELEAFKSGEYQDTKYFTSKQLYKIDRFIIEHFQEISGEYPNLSPEKKVGYCPLIFQMVKKGIPVTRMNLEKCERIFESEIDDFLRSPLGKGWVVLAENKVTL